MLNTEPCKFTYMKTRKSAETMGDRIRRSREQLGITQAELGAVAGISASAIGQCESGDTKQMKPENLFKIARKLGKSAEWLVTGEGTELPRESLYNALSELPGDSPQQSLDFLQYQIEKADGFIAREKMASYMAMIEDFKRDMKKRKG